MLRYTLTLLFAFFLLSAEANINEPNQKHIEMMFIHWPDFANKTVPKVRGVIRKKLNQSQMTLHRVDEPSELSEISALKTLHQALDQTLGSNILLQGCWTLLDGPITMLAIDYDQPPYHLYGFINVEQKRYFNVKVDLILEDGKTFWPIRMHKKTRSKQINYVEKMPIGMVFHIT